MKSLYRKYRPLRLEDVVGQEQVTVPLSNSLKAGKIGHAFLFVGPRGCGKTSVARILAHEVNDFKYDLEDNYVDIIEIDGASNRGIDNIRELREKVAIAPTSGKYKVYIIDEVHMLTKEAFNALLKTLEEPPAHAIFIMATTDAYKVPVTITSRSQTFTFKLVGLDVMVRHLRQIADNEHIEITDEALGIIAKRGGGSFRDSISLLDQLSTLSNDEITKEMVLSAMGLTEDEKILELLDSYACHDFQNTVALLRDLMISGIKPETLAEEIILCILENPKNEFMPLLTKLPDIRAPYAEAKLLSAFWMNQTNPEPQTKAQSSAHNQPITTNASSKTAEFNLSDFISSVRALSEAVYSQLIKAECEFVDGVLHIYPLKNVIKSILSRENNKRILIEAADGVKITIHDVDETPSKKKKDETLDRISAIMGGEVVNDGGGNPF